MGGSRWGSWRGARTFGSICGQTWGCSRRRGATRGIAPWRRLPVFSRSSRASYNSAARQLVDAIAAQGLRDAAARALLEVHYTAFVNAFESLQRRGAAAQRGAARVRVSAPLYYSAPPRAHTWGGRADLRRAFSVPLISDIELLAARVLSFTRRWPRFVPNAS